MEHQRLDFIVYVKQTSISHPLPIEGSFCVGRGEEAHVRIDDPSVSREHLLLHVSRSGVEVEELNSSNGTRLLPVARGGTADGTVLVPHRRYELEEGDVLRIGSASALVRVRELQTRPDLRTMPPSSFGSNRQNQPFRRDPNVRRVYQLAERAAASDISVLIIGETGVGKELLATAVHEGSERRKGPFLQLNCAAFSESLLESELFGHERGAFTGAASKRAGLLEATRGGTVLLDEMGEMPLSIQAKLLRVLEERKVRRVGANTSIPIDVRFIAATHRDLEKEVERGRFRGDLFYRISGIMLHLPPLRERTGEIEPLAHKFLSEFCERSGLQIPELTNEAVRALIDYPWPGNVRELKNAMERAPLYSAGHPIRAEHLPPLGHDSMKAARTPVNQLNIMADEALARTPVQTAPAPSSRHVAYAMNPARKSPTEPNPSRRFLEVGGGVASPANDDAPSQPIVEETSEQPLELVPPRLVHRNSRDFDDEQEEQALLQALERCAGNQTRAAKLLGVSRRTLINRMRRYGIARPRGAQRR